MKSECDIKQKSNNKYPTKQKEKKPEKKIGKSLMDYNKVDYMTAQLSRI